MRYKLAACHLINTIKQRSIFWPQAIHFIYSILVSVFFWPQCALSKSPSDYSLFDLSLEKLLQLQITSSTKSADTLSSVPASVTVITQEHIRLMGYLSLEELLIHIPGLYHTDNYEEFDLGIRGITGSSIAFLINGVQQHPERVKSTTIPERSRVNIPIESIDRIEITRGPASVIYGNNAFSGIINVITNEHRPKGNTFKVGAGNNSRNELFSRLSLEGDEYRTVFNLGYERHDGIDGELIEFMSVSQFTNQDPQMKTAFDGLLKQEAINADLYAEINRVNVNLRYSKKEYGIYALTPSFNQGNQIELNTIVSGISYHSSISENLKYKVNLTYSSEQYLFEPDFIIPNIQGYQDQGSKRIEAESLLNFDNNNNLRTTFGLNLLQLYDIRNVADLTSISYYKLIPNHKQNSIALFTNTTYDFLKNLQGSFGYRLTKAYEYNIDTYRDTALSQENLTRYNIPDQYLRALKIALHYSVNKNQSIKLIHSTATQNHKESALSKPERITSNEILYSYFKDNHQLNFSIFRHLTTDLLRKTLRAEGNTVIQQFDNKGEWLSNGIEALHQWKNDSSIFTESSLTWQHTTDKSSQNAEAGNSPELLGKFKIGYQGTHFYLASALIYVDNMNATFNTDVLNSAPQRLGEEVKSYWLLNLNIGYQASQCPLRINLHGFNLNNHSIRYTANELVDFEYGSPGPGRIFALQITYEY